MAQKNDRQFHPIRFYSSRRYIKRMINIYGPSVGTRGIPTAAEFSTIIDNFRTIYNDLLEEIPFEVRPRGMQVVGNEVSYFFHYAAYHEAGRNIFSLDPFLVKMFRHTDVNEILLSSIKLPYKAFYVSFGAQQDMDLYNLGRYVDGAYISEFSGKIQIVISTIPKEDNLSGEINWVLHPDRYYYFSIERQLDSETIGEALEKALSQDKPFEIKNFDAIDEDMANLAKSKGIKLSSIYPETSKIIAEEKKKGYPIFLEALKLLFNGLCFITRYKDKIDQRFSDSAPKTLVQKFQNSKTPKEKKRNESKLAQLGFTLIKYCGASYAKELTGTGHELDPHWRRGHWRNQVCGDNYSEHKIIWIMPTIVRKDKGMPLKGHIYDVDSEN